MGEGLAAWVEENHPRDANGRFGGGGEAKGAKAGGERVFTDKLPAGLKEETWHAHYDAHPDKGGKPSAERVAAVHEPIMREALNVDKPAPDDHKIAIMTMGAPASGKSSGLQNVDTSKFVKVDPDDIKTKIPEYKQAMNPEATYRGAAMMAHEESSHVAKEVMKQAVADGKHVIVDGTGTNAKSMTGKMQQLKQSGYKVHLVMSHLHVEEGVKRAAERGQKTGRVVPESIIRHAYQTVPKNFREIAQHADSFAVHDTSKPGSPLAWERKMGGAEIHHDPAFVEKFKKDHF